MYLRRFEQQPGLTHLWRTQHGHLWYVSSPTFAMNQSVSPQQVDFEGAIHAINATFPPPHVLPPPPAPLLFRHWGIMVHAAFLKRSLPKTLAFALSLCFAF